MDKAVADLIAATPPLPMRNYLVRWHRRPVPAEVHWTRVFAPTVPQAMAQAARVHEWADNWLTSLDPAEAIMVIEVTEK